MPETQSVHSLIAPIENAPRTVVSLVPSITESLFDLNLGEYLIGRTDYCIYPEGAVERVPTIGGTKNPDIERIIAMRPELVFANAEENRKEDVEKLRDADIPVWVSMPTKVADVFTLLWNIMYLFDETSMVARVRLIEQIYDRLVSMGEARSDDLPTVFVPIWYDPLMTANAETYLHDLLLVCGGMNVFADRQRQFPLKADLGQQDPNPTPEGRDTRYPRVTFEEVESKKPDIILLPSEPFQFTEEHIPIFAQLDVPASKNNRIHLVDGSWLTWHGTRLAYALNDLPALLRET
ncbi:MAG: helical backbone metal receptor [Chloroflexota bacterium]